MVWYHMVRIVCIVWLTASDYDVTTRGWLASTCGPGVQHPTVNY